MVSLWALERLLAEPFYFVPPPLTPVWEAHANCVSIALPRAYFYCSSVLMRWRSAYWLPQSGVSHSHSEESKSLCWQQSHFIVHQPQMLEIPIFYKSLSQFCPSDKMMTLQRMYKCTSYMQIFTSCWLLVFFLLFLDSVSKLALQWKSINMLNLFFLFFLIKQLGSKLTFQSEWLTSGNEPCKANIYTARFDRQGSALFGSIWVPTRTLL